MPSVPLSPDNDYRFPPAPAEALLDRATWDAVMGSTEPGKEGLGPRMRALEAKRIELQAVVDDLRLFGLQRLDTAIVPLIDATKEEIRTLQEAVAQTIEQNGQVIEDFQVQIAAALQSLNDDLDALRTQVDLILGGGIPANNVAESDTRVFVSPAQRADLGELRTDLEALLQSLDQTFQSLGESIASRQATSEKNQPSGYAGLDNSGLLPAILLPLRPRIVVDIFTQSGPFVKAADDLFYYADLFGAGGSGGRGTQYNYGGCPGEWISGIVMPSQLAASVNVIVGAGGASQGGALNGLAGGESSFGPLKARGGPGGGGSQNTIGMAPWDLGGYYGQNSADYRGLTSARTPRYTGWVWGYGNTFSGSQPAPTVGECCGGGYRSGVMASTQGGTGGLMGQPGNAPGGGGGGQESGASGAGARGEVRIYRIKGALP